MDGSRLLTTLLLAALAAGLVLPTATAHSPAHSADGRVRASIGLLNEPVSTYMSTGLDICFTQNTTTSPRPAIAISDLGTLQATLTAPNGETHTAPLSAQFGRTGCVTFNEPLVLTQPGQYKVALSGSINGTTFAATGINAGGAVRDRDDITFPDEGLVSDQELQQRIADLEARLATLEAEGDGEGSNGVPAPAGALLLVGLVALAAVLRRR